MRHLVPFVGEQKVVRADDEQARIKRTNGRVIDEIVGDGKVKSSWDDVVPTGWADKTKPKPTTKPAVSASMARPNVPVPIKTQPKTLTPDLAKKAVSPKPPKSG